MKIPSCGKKRNKKEKRIPKEIALEEERKNLKPCGLHREVLEKSRNCLFDKAD